MRRDSAAFSDRGGWPRGPEFALLIVLLIIAVVALAAYGLVGYLASVAGDAAANETGGGPNN